MRKLLNPHQKATLALAAMNGDKTFNELASEHQVHPSQLSEWKKILEKESFLLFNPHNKNKEEQRIAELERMIGQREAEIEWLKKNLHSLNLQKKS
ncbi:MAG: transposase [Candidatus Magasanikbacteria bacterium]|nr:transposase [Candidatus Magasanikbacteria bacterium]